MYDIILLERQDINQLFEFLNNLYKNYWSLTSNAYQREPNSKALVTRESLIQELESNSIFILKRDSCIISTMRIAKKNEDPTTFIFSQVETHPDFQKRGIFGLVLGEGCLRNCLLTDCRRIELTTWSFNRKGIPFYKRYGFRAVPRTNLLMENYLPSIVKHPDTQAYFDRHDYIRTLQNERSYGYDAIVVNGLSVFEYCWKPRKSDDTLRVWVDWQKKEIVDIECNVRETSSLVEEKNYV